MKYDNIRQLLGGLTNLVLPPRCPVTGGIVDRPGMVSPAAWAGLRFVSAPNCRCCGIPFDTLGDSLLPGDETLCGSCIAWPKPYDSRILGKRIVLLDDVHTTGATLEECVGILKDAGAQRVDVLTLARVVRPDALA